MAKTNQEVCADLIKNGAKRISGSIQRASVQILADWTRIRVELDTKVPAYIRQDDGTYVLGEDNVLFISMYGLTNGLRGTTYDVLLDHINNNPKSIQLVFKDAKVVMIPQMVKEGDVDDKGDVADHDTIWWHCQTLEIAGAGERWAIATCMGILGVPSIG